MPVDWQDADSNRSFQAAQDTWTQQNDAAFRPFEVRPTAQSQSNVNQMVCENSSARAHPFARRVIKCSSLIA